VVFREIYHRGGPMFDITPSELLTIAVVALIVFGPKRLVELSRKAGELAGQFRRYATEFRTGLEKEVDHATGPFREMGTTLAAAGKELVETADGELRWVDKPDGEDRSGGDEDGDPPE